MIVAERYDTGTGTRKSEEEAFRWYLKAAKLKHPTSQIIVAQRYERSRSHSRVNL